MAKTNGIAMCHLSIWATSEHATYIRVKLCTKHAAAPADVVLDLQTKSCCEEGPDACQAQTAAV